MRKALVFVCLYGCTATALAQPGDWTAVQGLSPGTSVKVRADHNSSTCSVTSVSDDVLVCQNGAEPHSYARAEVRRISLSARTKSTLRGALIGAGVGGATGLVIGAASTTGGNDWMSLRGEAIAITGGLGLIVGTATGAVVAGARNSAGHVIYKR